MTDKLDPASLGKAPDPADKTAGLDQFQPAVHRSGYGNKYEMVFRHAKLGHTLAAGEGKLLTDQIESLELQNRALESMIRQMTERHKATEDFG